MSPYKVLYYPSYDPSEPWLRGMLLLADQVTRIVPDDAHHADPDYINRIDALIPGAVCRVSPTSVDTQLDDVNLERLDRALHIIEPSIDRSARNILVDHKGGLSVENHVFLHISKLSPHVRDLLEHHSMLEEWDNFATGHLLVPKPVSDLILSYIADHLGTRIGYDTVTDHSLSFAVNSLDGLGVRAEGELRGTLLAAIIKLQIPREISTLSDDVYFELRERYAPIRQEFARVVATLSNTANLHSITDPIHVRARIMEEVSVFKEECDKLREERWMRRFRQYTPLAVGTLVSSIAAIFDMNSVAVGGALTGGMITVFHERIKSDPLTPEQKTKRLLADLRDDILDRSLLTSLS